jgi:hypothetical protein
MRYHNQIHSVFFIAFFLLAFSTNIFAAAGKVVYAFGDVTAVNDAGVSRSVRKGSDIDVGDTINTRKGRLQIRFSDGGFMSLQPQTEFKIDGYNFDGKEDGSEESYFNLIRGGLRAITGLIGRKNKEKYRVTTAVATIGIRGTTFNLYMCQSSSCTLPNGLKVAFGLIARTNDGEIYAQNKVETRNIPKGQAVRVPADDKPMEKVEDASVLASAQASKGKEEDEEETEEEQQEEAQEEAAQQVAQVEAAPLFESGAQRDESGIQEVFISEDLEIVISEDGELGVIEANANKGVLVLGAGVPFTGDFTELFAMVAIVGASGVPVGEGSFASIVSDPTGLDRFESTIGDTNTNLQLTPAGDAVLFFSNENIGLDGPGIFRQTFNAGTAVLTDTGSNLSAGNVFYGRWQGGNQVHELLIDDAKFFTPIGLPNPQQSTRLGDALGTHFIIGDIYDGTTADLNTIFNARARFLPAGGTRPTDSEGNIGTFLDGFLDLDFANATVDGKISIQMPQERYDGVFRGDLLIGSPNGGVNLTPFGKRGLNSGFCSGGICGSGQQVLFAIDGLFAGINGNGIITGYNFATFDWQRFVSGTQVFTVDPASVGQVLPSSLPGPNKAILITDGGVAFDGDLSGLFPLFLLGAQAIGIPVGAASFASVSFDQNGLDLFNNTLSDDTTNLQLSAAGNAILAFDSESIGVDAPAEFTASFDAGTATLTDAGSNLTAGNVFYGRWVGGNQSFEIFIEDAKFIPSIGLPNPQSKELGDALMGTHFIFGDAFGGTVNELSSSFNARARFLPAGGTRPTDSAGNVGTFLNGFLDLDFVSATVDGKISIQMPQERYDGVFDGDLLRGFPNDGVRFTPSFGGLSRGFCAGGICGGGQQVGFIIEGNFTGASGNGIIAGYKFNTFDLQRFVSGTQVFSVDQSSVGQPLQSDVPKIGFMRSSATGNRVKAFGFTSTPGIVTGDGALVDGTAFTVTKSLVFSADGKAVTGTNVFATITGNPTNFPPNFDLVGSTITGFFNAGTASLVDAGSDPSAGNIFYGRWVGNHTVSLVQDLSPLEISIGLPPGTISSTNDLAATPGGTHFIFGDPFPGTTAGLQSGVGSTARYLDAGGTSPTDNFGNVGTFLGGLIEVDFVDAFYQGGLSVQMPQELIEGFFFGSLANLPLSDNLVTATVTAQQIGGGATCTGGICGGGEGLLTDLSFGFTRANGEGIAFSYNFFKEDESYVVSGVQAFGLDAASVNQPLQGLGPTVLSAAWDVDFENGLLVADGDVFGVVDVFTSGSGPTRYEGTDIGDATPFQVGAEIASAQVLETFNDNNVIFQARWGDGTVNKSTSIPGDTGTVTLTGNQSLHFINGVPINNLPSLGSANYDFIQSTDSTTTSGATIGDGVTSGQLQVNFTAAQVNLNMNVNHEGTDYGVFGLLDIFQTAGRPVKDRFTNLNFGGNPGGSVSCAPSCNASVDGFFAGNTQTSLGTTPSHAGIAYEVDSSIISDQIHGTASFGLDPLSIGP